MAKQQTSKQKPRTETPPASTKPVSADEFYLAAKAGKIVAAVSEVQVPTYPGAGLRPLDMVRLRERRLNVHYRTKLREVMDGLTVQRLAAGGDPVTDPWDAIKFILDQV